MARLQAGPTSGPFFAFLGPFNRQRRLSRTAPMVPSEPPRYGVHSLRCAVTVYEESMWWWVLTISSLRSEIVIVSFVGVVPRRLPAAKDMRSVMCHECVACRPCDCQMSQFQLVVEIGGRLRSSRTGAHGRKPGLLEVKWSFWSACQEGVVYH